MRSRKSEITSGLFPFGEPRILYSLFLQQFGLFGLWFLISGICLAVGNKSEWAVGRLHGACTGSKLVYLPLLITLTWQYYFSHEIAIIHAVEVPFSSESR